MIRSYQDSDYEQLKHLYESTDLYGGAFDEARDGRERLASKISSDPEAILVYEEDDKLLGTISIIEDGRVAWLYRFIVKDFDDSITKSLYDAAITVIKSRGHTQVLIYSAIDSTQLDQRYELLSMTKGDSYACFWQNI